MKQQRNTRQRQMVIDAVRTHGDHPSADQIYADVRSADPRISRGTVYRNLNFLVRQGDVLRVKMPDADRFECRLTPHYHFLCTSCGAVCDVSMPYRLELDAQATCESGFTVDCHRIVFEGLCPKCMQKRIGSNRK